MSTRTLPAPRETDLRAQFAATLARVEDADSRFAAAAGEIWSVPALSERAEELRALRDAAFADLRTARAELADLRRKIAAL